MLWHHRFALGALFIGIVGGYFLVGLGCFTILMEFSTIFLNLRSYIRKEEYNQPFSMVI
jgi:hypothetical protein